MFGPPLDWYMRKCVVKGERITPLHLPEIVRLQSGKPMTRVNEAPLSKPRVVTFRAALA
jgi:hypothetical protein